MKVCLTGAAGFIGLHIAAALGEAGHDVVGVDALLPQAHGALASVPDGLVVADIRTADLDGLLKGIDVVCHQAAVVGNGVDAQDFPDYAAHNDYGTAVLLAAMARTGVRNLVLASSMVVYGDGRYRCEEHGVVAPAVREPADLDAGSFDPRCSQCGERIAWQEISEDTPFNPRTSYAASKVAQEHYAGSWCTLESARAIALRYHNVYGPGMPADTPYAGVAAIFRSALARGEAPRVFEDGNQVRDFVHVRDVARANVAAIERVAEHPRSVTAYNIASGQPFTIGAMAEQLATAAGGPRPIVTGAYRAFDVRHIVASPQAAVEGLGFTAAIGPAEGISALATEPLRRR